MALAPGFAVLAVALAAGAAAPALHAWGGQGHRLVGLIAANHLTPPAKQNVAWLLGGQSLADVAGWATRRTRRCSRS